MAETYRSSADSSRGRNGCGCPVWVDNVLPWEGGVDGTPSDIGVDDIGVGGVGLDINWLAGIARAGSTSDTWIGWVGIEWVCRVEPKHADVVIVPD